jgi:hypothetical protein
MVEGQQGHEEEELKLPPHDSHSPRKVMKMDSSQRERLFNTYKKMSEKSFRCFYRGLTIASVLGPRIFENVMAGFQRDVFESMADSLEQLRDGKMPDKRRFWIERTKKASKDADLAVIVIWLIAFARRPFYSQVGAANSEQAAIVKQRISHLLHWNPWLGEHIELVQSVVRSKKKLDNGQPLAKMDIMSSDVAGAHGGTPDLLIVNELSHMKKWEFAENLLDNADGVAQGIVIIATNAGYKGTKAEVWRNNAIKSTMWHVNILAKPAPWHSKEFLKDTQKRNPPSRFRRLWWGVWVTGQGDAVAEEKIDQAFVMDGPLSEPEDGWEYVLGLDLSVSNDHSGLMVLGINYLEQKLKTAWWKAWTPSVKTREVDLIDVENTVYMVFRLFRASFMFYDPFQAKLLAQRLNRRGVCCKEMSFQVPNNLVKMASSFVQVLDAGKLQCYDDPDGRLRRDFSKFKIVEKSYGHRLEAVSDEYGHADVGTALAICLPYGVDALGGFNSLQADDELMFTGSADVSEDEMKKMPSEFKELFEMEASWKDQQHDREDFQDYLEELV